MQVFELSNVENADEVDDRPRHARFQDVERDFDVARVRRCTESVLVECKLLDRTVGVATIRGVPCPCKTNRDHCRQ